jgi:hypothetical protein
MTCYVRGCYIFNNSAEKMEVQDIVQEVRQEIQSFREKNPDGVVVIR